MSYDINLYYVNPCYQEIFNKMCNIMTSAIEQGDLKILDCLTEPTVKIEEINITYNYAHIFRRIFGDEGIRVLYGKTGEQSIHILEEAIAQLEDNVTPDNLWKPTDGNAKLSLITMLNVAKEHPEGIWKGD